MGEDDYRLQKRIDKIKQDSEITDQFKQFLLNDYLNYQKRSGAKKESTQERYLRRLKKIFQHIEKDFQDLKNISDQELKKLNTQIVDDIQNNKYKHGSGDFSKRNKRGYWNVWKRCLETLGYETGSNESYIPGNVKFSTNRGTMKDRVDTSPEDLPTPEQMKQFLKGMEKYTSRGVALRNQALMALIWDAGPRIGEALEIKFKDVSVTDDRLRIYITGNKKSSDRKIEIFQGRKTITDYIESHPKKNDPEAYVFSPLAYDEEGENYYRSLSRNPLRQKIHSVRNVHDLDFKTENEPFHIFRKAMTTYYVVNDILSWEKVCERQGKSPDGTMPTYLKMAMQDIDASAAEGFGLDTEDREMEHRMRAPPLLPQECTDCDMVNRCYKDVCVKCSAELPESEMPKGKAFPEEDELKAEAVKNKVLKDLMSNPDQKFSQVLEKHIDDGI